MLTGSGHATILFRRVGTRISQAHCSGIKVFMDGFQDRLRTDSGRQCSHQAILLIDKIEKKRMIHSIFSHFRITGGRGLFVACSQICGQSLDFLSFREGNRRKTRGKSKKRTRKLSKSRFSFDPPLIFLFVILFVIHRLTVILDKNLLIIIIITVQD